MTENEFMDFLTTPQSNKKSKQGKMSEADFDAWLSTPTQTPMAKSQPTQQVIAQQPTVSQPTYTSHAAKAQQGMQQAQEKFHAAEKPMTAKLQAGQPLTPTEATKYAQEQGIITPTEASKRINEINAPLKTAEEQGKTNVNAKEYT